MIRKILLFLFIFSINISFIFARTQTKEDRDNDLRQLQKAQDEKRKELKLKLKVENYKNIFENAELFWKNKEKANAIKNYAYLYRTGHLPPDKKEITITQMAEYFFEQSLYGIAIGYFEEQFREGKIFTDNFSLQMGKTYEYLGDLHKAKKTYETTLATQSQTDEIVNKELAEIDRINSFLTKNKKGVLDIKLIHPKKPFKIGDEMLVEIKLRNVGLKPIKVDIFVNNGVSRSIAIAMIKDWSKIITTNEKNILQKNYTHPSLEFREKIPKIKKEDIVELRPGDEYTLKINLWKYLEANKEEIVKKEEPILDEFCEYFICLMYGDFLLTNRTPDLYQEPAYSKAILVTINNSVER